MATNEQLAYESYWDERYQNSDGDRPTHEWFQSFEKLRPFLEVHLTEQQIPAKDLRILHLGCGDSNIPLELYNSGYRNQICIDFSKVVIEQMIRKHANYDSIEWLHGDVRDMHQIKDRTIDVAFDKGTLDAMISGSPWDPPDHVKENIHRYLDEVARVLKHGGIFLYITFRQPHFMKPFLRREKDWQLSVQELNDGEATFGYFGYVMKSN